DSSNSAYILTGNDGRKSHLSFTAGTSYDSDDSTYTNYNSGTHVLAYKSGTKVSYQPFPSLPDTLLRPTQIQDTNGNTITIAYVSGKDQAIDTITDTIGRVVKYNYDSNGKLASITQNNGNLVIKTYATFAWSSIALTY